MEQAKSFGEIAWFNLNEEIVEENSSIKTKVTKHRKALRSNRA